ncbi:MAG: AI-2E family transporter [Ruminococcus sp.]|jgi:predicted PurR-regulated permease PerM|nr:AI-2E family transporter [Ruminococcus sp.]
MDKFKEIVNKRWFSNAIAGCITVVCFLLLSNIGSIWDSISKVIGYFSTAIGGCVMAYMMNPLAKFYQRTFFRRIPSKRAQWVLSISLVVVTVICFVVLTLLTLVPQLVESITNFVNNIGLYAASVQKLLDNIDPDVSRKVNVRKFVDSSEKILNEVVAYISDNSTEIINFFTTAGKGMFNWIVAFILSVYLLAGKERIKTGSTRLMKAVMAKPKYDALIYFLKHCDAVLNRYIVFTVIDALIVGTVNAIFMMMTGMQYVALVSFVVAITNLAPTFGPIVGGVIGGFILLMVDPKSALVFLIFTLILQLCDGYFIKPKLFGSTLGVPGLLILIAIIVGGRIFGIIGILLAIPFAAICDHFYRENLLPYLEKRRIERDRKYAEKQSVQIEPEDVGETD